MMYSLIFIVVCCVISLIIILSFTWKVGNTFAPSNRSPTRSVTKKSPVRENPVVASPESKPTAMPAIPDDRDDYEDDSFDESDEIITGNENNIQAGGETEAEEEPPEKLSEIEQTVKELFEEEEQLLNLHMTTIHENAELLTEEGRLLNSVQGEEDYDIDMYANRLGEILDRKTELIHSLQDRLESFRELLRKEEELSGLH